MRLSRGTSMPAIRAMCLLLPLALLVLRVVADHAHDSMPADDLALLTATLDGCLYFHALLPESIRDAPARQVVRGKLDEYTVAGHDLDVMQPHLAGDVGQDL